MEFSYTTWSIQEKREPLCKVVIPVGCIGFYGIQWLWIATGTIRVRAKHESSLTTLEIHWNMAIANLLITSGGESMSFDTTASDPKETCWEKQSVPIWSSCARIFLHKLLQTAKWTIDRTDSSSGEENLSFYHLILLYVM